MKIIKAAEALYLATGNHKMVAECVPLVQTYTDVKAASSNANNIERALNAPSRGSISVNQRTTKFGIFWMLLGFTPSPHLRTNYLCSPGTWQITFMAFRPRLGHFALAERYFIEARLYICICNNGLSPDCTSRCTKRHPQELRFTSSLMNRITNESRIIERTSKDAEHLDVPHSGSPTPQSIMRRDMQELLEIVDRLRHQVSYLQQEREEVRREHESQVERYRTRIDLLEDEVLYRQTIIDVISDDVDRLEEETEQQQKELNDIMERERLNAIARNERNQFLQDVVSGLTYTDDL
ncbi:hypothetical protein BDR06DRAFT_1046548 [Suillus hirtellus]|nr:hypothetical protein BDR06DRAFT_1046548 [Suillus hirtellus]